MADVELPRRQKAEKAAKPRKLRLQQRQRFRQEPRAKRPAAAERADEAENVQLPEHVEIDAADLSLFAEIEARVAAAPLASLAGDYQSFRAQEARENPARDPQVAELYGRLGEVLQAYRSGKLPHSFNVIPLVDNWRALLELTEPARWTPHSFYEGVKSFVAAAESDRTVGFFQFYLLPRVLKDIRETRQLNYHLFRALAKALYRPASFFQGLVLQFMDSPDTTLRQAQVLCAVFGRKAVPRLHLAAALLQALDRPYTAPNSLVLKALVEKKAALPGTVISRLALWFCAFAAPGTERMPVVWHQTLLSFVRCYRIHLSPAERKKISSLVRRKFFHEGISPEIIAAFSDPVAGAPDPHQMEEE